MVKIQLNYTPYPVVDVESPVGKWIIVQYPIEKRVTAGGIILTDDTRDMDTYRQVEAKIVAIGPLAFMRADGTPFANRGSFPYIGDIVRVPQYPNVTWVQDEEDNEVKFAALDPGQLISVKKKAEYRPTWEQLNEEKPNE